MDSLLMQDYPYTKVLIRDDGSTDGTPEFLRRQYGTNEAVNLIIEKNIGITASFMRLLTIASRESAFLAFCDQDDIWMTDKLSSAVKMLSAYPEDIPLLYSSRVIVADMEPRPLYESPSYLPRPSLANALVENIFMGCTMIFNRAAHDLIIQRLPEISRILMHDWWTYLVVSCFGNIIFDATPRVIYRQHSDNAIGVRSGAWSARTRRFLKPTHALTRQALEFERVFGAILQPDSKRILSRFLQTKVNVFNRLIYIFTGDAYRQKRLDDVILKCLVLLNRI